MPSPLHGLLRGRLDYAGLYPPAALGQREAWDEYVRYQQSPHAWLLGRFCTPARARGVFTEFAAHDGVEAEASAIGTPVAQAREAAESIGLDVKKWLPDGPVEAVTYEVRLPTEEAGVALRALKKATEQGPFDTVFVEFGWGEGWSDALHEALGTIEEVGLKARCGGLSATDFPGTAQIAEFIYLGASLDAPMKFTAGIHQPLWHFDEALGVHRHGFVNLFVATALAELYDLTPQELEEVLVLGADGFAWDDRGVIVLGQRLEAIDLVDCPVSGWGSCSVAEPVEALATLGWR
ncbi:MAG: hypothetical protein KF857_03940 [Fimbriimonadaceae bacterium]|nr:hypothetical protein [Fimbriimonadaceae bacterium]